METGFFAKSGLVLAIPALVLSLIVNPSVAGAQTDETNRTNVTSNVDTEELCSWNIMGIPAGISMTASRDEYDGTAMSLAAERENFNINSTGPDTSDLNEFQDCTFYGSPTVPTITVEIDSTSFEATVGGNDDNAMDIALDSDNAFDITFTADTCTGWTTNTLTLFDTDADDFVTLNESVRTPLVYDASSQDPSKDTQRCKGSLGFEVDVPAGKTPTSPGSEYIFTGPSLTFSASFPAE